MVSPEIVKEWLDKADEDFKFASINLTEGHNFYAQICFHFQQAAEKYLKSFIVVHDLEFEKTHNLIKLLNTCSDKQPALHSITDECERLNTAYIDTRYPVHWPTGYTKEKALLLQGDAQKVAETVKGLLKEGGYV